MNTDRPAVLNLIKVSLKYTLIITLTVTVAVFLAAPLIANFYIHDADPITHKMTTEGIYLFIAFLPLYTVGTVFQYFYQSYGRLKLVSCFAILDNGLPAEPRRLVRKISTEFDYVNVLKLNNLIVKF